MAEIDAFDILPNIANNDRCFLTGQTGSGKTTLARVIVQQYPFSVVHDYKGNIKWPGFVRCESLKELQEKGADVKNPRLIYAPNHQELDDEEKIDEFFRWIYLRRNTAVYVDEVYSICKRIKAPHFFQACITRGRELGITTICSSQRPSMLPMFVLSESEHYYVFRLQLPKDRKRIEEIIGIPEDKILMEKHKFYYATSGGEFYGPLTLRLD